MSWATSWFSSFPLLHQNWVCDLKLRWGTHLGSYEPQKNWNFLCYFVANCDFYPVFNPPKLRPKGQNYYFPHIVRKRVLLNLLETAIKRKSIFVKIGTFCCIGSQICVRAKKFECENQCWEKLSSVLISESDFTTNLPPHLLAAQRAPKAMRSP